MLQLTSERWTRWLAIGAAALTLGACQPSGPTSENPIEGFLVADDGSALLGAWHGELNGYEAFVHVVDGGRDGALQTLVIARQDEEGGGWGAMRAIPAKLDGTGYLSIEVLQDKSGSVDDPIERGFHLVRYRTGPGDDYVTLYALDDTLIDNAIKSGALTGDPHSMRLSASSQELINFIEKHRAQDLFSVQIGYLEHVTDDELPKDLTIR